jgi:subtilisin family serine protease
MARLFFLSALVLNVASVLSTPAAAAPRALLPHEQGLLAMAAAPAGVRVLITLHTAVDTSTPGPFDETHRRAQIADAHARFGAELSGFGARVIRRYSAFPIVLANVDAVALQHVFDLDDVAGVQADQALQRMDNQTDATIGAPIAWSSGFDGAGEVVAVLDTGVQESHPFLSSDGTTARTIAELEGCFSGIGGAVGSVTSLCPGGVYSETGDANGNLDGANCNLSIAGCEHGTHVAGIAAGTGAYAGGNNENGVAIAAALMPVQVFSCADNGGTCTASAFDSDVISALEWVHDRAVNTTFHIAAVNLSIGVAGTHYTAYCDTVSTAYKNAIDTLRNTDQIATVISAGNDAFTDGVDYPACISSAISVAATDNNDVVASYSNSAPFVSLFAPGNSVYSSIPDSSYGYMSGTSMAAPQVSGALAVLQSKFAHQASVSQLLTILQKTGKQIAAPGYSRPRLDLGAAADDLFMDGFGD